jgi:hypothetical protein
LPPEHHNPLAIAFLALASFPSGVTVMRLLPHHRKFAAHSF